MADYRCVEDTKFEDELVSIIQNAYDEAKNDDRFYVGLSGGSMPPLLVKCLRKLKNVEWSKWYFFFCDERLVPSASEDSTYGAYKRLISSTDPLLPLSLSQFITIDPSLPGPKAADDYLSKLRQHFGSSGPRFNILFLGIGPDGHTCSLFPNHKLLKEQNRWVCYIGDSPKPPPQRVTFTLTVLAQARLSLFIVQGASKAGVVKDIIENNASVPANMINSPVGKLVWLIDSSAASMLKK